jgi:hypothetical protein
MNRKKLVTVSLEKSSDFLRDTNSESSMLPLWQHWNPKRYEKEKGV